MDDCLFCRIISRQVHGEIVYENDSIVAFRDINPKSPVHILLVPRKHIASVVDIGTADAGVVGEIFQVAAQLAKDQGIQQQGFRVVVNSGPAAGQSVYHLHFHLMGGRSFSWPPG